ncbi:5-oxoprolinase subunit PxpB [Variovorax sp. YR216]|uniref:5-oxoprolinase subunit PxpB n=1 Tax=Variovorax sp. YR216 TaxID=1882828 RepID=UPI000898BA18|nr:5-oxoprolinase subunit PxpB [Variovorax sp. YR216]SEA78475.1 sensor histidine kinase inhibitor, KipI family [Variovorax sp. YR216]
MNAAALPRLHPLGEAALVCELPPPATLAQQQQIWALAAEAVQWHGVSEVLPGMNNLSLLFDPEQIDGVELEMQVLSAWPQLAAATVEGRRIEIPVVYGGEWGPDLADVAAHTGLTPADVVRRHCEGDYVVYLLGFLPGFAFMGGLAPELATPRRAAPRVAVPTGSVGIGGEQTGIYPMVSPGGWNLIGRTSVPLFDPGADAPTLLRPGDHVRFVAERVEL